MLPLILTVALATGISALCSTIEAMLYSVTWTQIEQMKEKAPRAGELFYNMRLNIEKPISAILTLNTVANTAGATIAGALATSALGAENLLFFSILFTIIILLFGEIIPKTIGVVYCAGIGRILAYPLHAIIILLSPITFVISFITKLITPKENAPSATEDDIKVMASLSRKSGGIQDFEETIISNILELDSKKVEEVMTPRTVVFSMPMTFSLKEAHSHEDFWHFSRIPVYDNDNEDLVGIVYRREITMKMSEGKGDLLLGDVMRPIHFVLESQTLDVVMHKFLDLRQHLFAVLEELGGLAGVISLEDILEEMIGREIVDESDMETDMREAARNRKEQALAYNKLLIKNHSENTDSTNNSIVNSTVKSPAQILASAKSDHVQNNQDNTLKQNPTNVEENSSEK